MNTIKTDYTKMSLAELREVARVQAHELATLKTTQFKDEFARRLGLAVLKELKASALVFWTEEQTKIYTDVAELHPVGARCWRTGA